MRSIQGANPPPAGSSRAPSGCGCPRRACIALAAQSQSHTHATRPGASMSRLGALGITGKAAGKTSSLGAGSSPAAAAAAAASQPAEERRGYSLRLSNLSLSSFSPSWKGEEAAGRGIRLSNLSLSSLSPLPGKTATPPPPPPLPTEDPTAGAEPAWMDKLSSLDAVLADSQARKALQDFAKAAYADESLLCLRAIDLWDFGDFQGLEEHLKRANAPEPSYFPALSDAAAAEWTSEQVLQFKTARWLFETFFLPDAPQWTCLESSALVALNYRLSQSRPLEGNEFAHARLEVLRSITRGIFAEFHRRVHENPAQFALADSRALNKELSEKGIELIRESLSMDSDTQTDRRFREGERLDLRVKAMREGGRPSSLLRRIFSGSNKSSASNGTGAHLEKNIAEKVSYATYGGVDEAQPEDMGIFFRLGADGTVVQHKGRVQSFEAPSPMAAEGTKLNSAFQERAR